MEKKEKLIKSKRKFTKIVNISLIMYIFDPLNQNIL